MIIWCLWMYSAGSFGFGLILVKELKYEDKPWYWKLGFALMVMVGWPFLFVICR